MINPDLVCALPGPLGRRYCAENFPRPLPGPNVRPSPAHARDPSQPPSDASPASISTLMRRCRLAGEGDGGVRAIGDEFWFVRQPVVGEGPGAQGPPEEELFVRGGHCVRTRFAAAPAPLSASPTSNEEDSIDSTPSTTRIPLGHLASLTSDVVSAGDATIVAACWATFVVPKRSFVEKGLLWNAVSVLDDPAGNRCSGVCLLTSENCLLFYTTQGEKFEARVPFQVWNMWPARNGLLLERQLTDEEKANRFRLPCVFFLGHPLDEPSPVVLYLPATVLAHTQPPTAAQTPTGSKDSPTALYITTSDGARVQFANEAHQRIVFVSNEDSDSPLVLTYDHQARQHCLWRLRAAVESEYTGLLMIPTGPAALAAPVTPVGPPPVSSFVPGLGRGLSGPSSPLSPFARSLSRLTHSPASPLLPQHLSRLSQSPATPRLAASPRLSHPLRPGSACLQSPGLGGGPLDSELWEDGTGIVPEPLLPQACFHMLWTEALASAGSHRRTQTSQASAAPHRRPVLPLERRVTAFISEDHVTSRHLCYLVENAQRLCCVKLEPVTSAKGTREEMAFGGVQFLPALQAVYMPGQRLIALLDPRHTVFLYSGTFRVCKLALPCLGSTLADGMTPSEAGGAGSPKISTDTSPPHAGAASTPGQPRLLLQDPSQHAFTVEQAGTGLGFRIYLPPLASCRLVRRCLTALRLVLPRDVGLRLVGRWYSLRHAPGLDPARPAEHVDFARFVLLAAGYGESWPVLAHLTGQTEPDGTGGRMAGGCASTEQPAKRMRRGSGAAGDGHFGELLSRLERPEGQSSRGVVRLALGCSPEEREKPGRGKEAAAAQKDLNLSSSLLGRHLPVVLYALHLVYEEEKLIEEEWGQLDCLAGLLFLLSRDLGLTHFAEIYICEYPESVGTLLRHTSACRLKDPDRLTWPSYLQANTERPPHLMAWLVSLLSNRFLSPFPYLPGVNDFTKTMVSAFVLFNADDNQLERQGALWDRYLQLLPSSSSSLASSGLASLAVPADCLSPARSPLERLLTFLSHTGVDAAQLNRLPGGLSLAFREALRLCLLRPPRASPATYRLVGREDLARQAAGLRPSCVRPLRDPPAHYTRHVGSGSSGAGVVSVARLLACSQLAHPLLAALECDPIVQALFPADLRVREAYRLLQTSTRVRLRPGAQGRTEAPEDYQNQLLAVSVRTLALPAGRGLLTLHLHSGELPNKQIIPPICLQGKVGPRNLNVELKKAETPVTYKYWPEFHNGVAAALVYSPLAPIDSSWILYTSRSLLKLSADGGESGGSSGCVLPEKAGFLLGLGLNGHLNQLPHYDIKRFKYHEMVTMALLLGLCAGRRASLDQKLTRILAIHYGPLLPPAHGGPASHSGGASTGELEMHRYVQASAVMGLGLLYQGSAHRHMAEVLLREIGRGPGTDIAHREVMALTAGAALGLVMLGKGESAHGGFHDLNMAETLHAYMTGGLVRPTGAGDGPGRTHSGPGASLPAGGSVIAASNCGGGGGGTCGNNQIREGQHYNVDVTSPGATLALGLMFLGTGNRGIADWLAVPETQFLLDNVRPDLLLLRTLSRGLILWEAIEPSDEWIDSHIPCLVRRFAYTKRGTRRRAAAGEEGAVEAEHEEEEEEDRATWVVDYETMTLAHLNTECGCALAMALRFAGTADQRAFTTLMGRLNGLLTRGGGNTHSELLEAGNRSAFEQALGLLLLSVSIVMAGTGSLEVLALCRMLRARVGQGAMFGVSYGCHMMYAMATGFLFLGGGKLTLDNSPESAAILVCALFPKFPCMGNDNKYHMQAFRHLAVLAARARCLCPISVSSNRVFPSTMRLVLKSGLVMERVTLPHNLPPLDRIERIELHDPHGALAWPLHLSMDNPHHQLLLNNALGVMGGVLFVQERDASSADDASKLVLESYMAKLSRPLHMWQLRFLAVFARACRSQLDSEVAATEGASSAGTTLLSSDVWRSTVIAINHKFVELGEGSSSLSLSVGLERYYAGDSSVLRDGALAAFIIWHGLPPRGLLTMNLDKGTDWRQISFGQFCSRTCELVDTSVASLWQLFRLLQQSVVATSA